MQATELKSFVVSDSGGMGRICDVARQSLGWSSLEAKLLMTPSPRMSVDWVSASGIRLARGHLPAMSIVSRPKPSRTRPGTCLYYIDQPGMRALSGEAPAPCAAREVVMIRGTDPYAWLVPKPFTYMSMTVESDLFEQYMRGRGALLSGPIPAHFHVDHILREQLESAWLISDAGHLEAAAHTILGAITEVLSLTELTGPKNGDDCAPTTLDVRRAQVKAFIERHYACPELSTESIAKALHLSVRYVHRAFAANGQSPMAYIKQCRLHAAERLINTPSYRDVSITEIALNCGFSSSSHFATEFKRQFGVSPRDYRNARRLSDPDLIEPLRPHMRAESAG